MVSSLLFGFSTQWLSSLQPLAGENKEEREKEEIDWQKDAQRRTECLFRLAPHNGPWRMLGVPVIKNYSLMSCHIHDVGVCRVLSCVCCCCFCNLFMVYRCSWFVRDNFTSWGVSLKSRYVEFVWPSTAAAQEEIWDDGGLAKIRRSTRESVLKSCK